jgi:hypothetical protein
MPKYCWFTAAVCRETVLYLQELLFFRPKHGFFPKKNKKRLLNQRTGKMAGYICVLFKQFFIRMKCLKFALVVLIMVLVRFTVSAQDTLPKFSVKNVGNNRVILGWVNNYQVVKQISIQRAFDSLGIYKTILSVADPMAVQNGFADTKAPNDHMYYRLFIMLDKGMFFFSEAKKPVWDTTRAVTQISGENKIIVKDTVKLSNGTVVIKTDTVAVAKPVVIKKPEYIPSVYVYTNGDGYLFVNLPDAEKKKYHIKFYEEDQTFLFELKNIKETALTLDKTNFFHSGWFHFELYNDDKLVEKNKFFLARDY